MKFPVVDNGPTTPDIERCALCHQAMPHDDSDIWINVGAMQGTPDYQSIAKSDMFAFFHVRDHRGKAVEIVNNGLRGQADIGFCSTQCLRDFFNTVVDALEEKLHRNIIDELAMDDDDIDFDPARVNLKTRKIDLD